MRSLRNDNRREKKARLQPTGRFVVSALSLCLCAVCILALSSCFEFLWTPEFPPVEDYTGFEPTPADVWGTLIPGVTETETLTHETTPHDPYVPGSSTYAYDQLSEQEQELYRRMKDALMDHSPYIEEGVEDFTHDELWKTHQFVLLDSPEIFWANGNGTTYTIGSGGDKKSTKYEFNYILDQSDRNARQAQIDAYTGAFLDSIAQGLDEYGRVLAVYEHLISDTEYDLGVKAKKAQDIQDDETSASQTIASVFIDKKTVCSGYSKATQYLLNKLGVFCIYITGSAKGEGSGHAWNMVRIDGDYYLLDTTWGNPVNITSPGEKVMTYNYFLLTTGEFNKTHTPDEDIPLPVCTATRYNYFVYNNLLLDEYDKARVEDIIRNAVAGRKTGAHIKLSDTNEVEKAVASLFGNEMEIFGILNRAASIDPALDTTSISHSIDLDAGVIYIEWSYK